MVNYHKTIPLDARIFIDYDKKDVKFQYPQKITKLKQFLAVYSFCVYFWLEIVLKLIPITLILLVPLAVITFVDGSIIFKPLSASDTISLKILGLFIAFTLYSIFFIPLLFVLYYYKHRYVVSKNMPKLNVERYNTRFVSIFTKTNSNTIKIPIYNNITLDYWLKGDFKKQIKSVEVKEMENVKLYKYKNKKLVKELPQTKLWQAVFTFKQEPKDGKLIAIYI